jgi:hypothetical protein
MRIGVRTGWATPCPCVPRLTDTPLFTNDPALSIGIDHAAIGMAARGPAVLRCLPQSGCGAHRHVSLLKDGAGIIVLVTNITDQKRHEEHIRLLLREVNHRSKNMLSLVQAVARQTLAARPECFIDRFVERIQALAANQDLLVKNSWKGVDLEELAKSQLAHFKDLIGTRIALKGPSLLISASAAQTIGMALHELATNAGKYGAQSRRFGEGCPAASQLRAARSRSQNPGPDRGGCGGDESAPRCLSRRGPSPRCMLTSRDRRHPRRNRRQP